MAQFGVNITDILCVIFDNSYLEFNGKIYKQVTGLPMGNSLSGVLAILYMDALEKMVLSRISPYKRDVDDIVYLASSKELIFEACDNEVNEIKFEIEYLRKR